MFMHHFSGIGMPLVFSPKVTPDPADAEKLQEKLQHAMQQLTHDLQQGRLRAPVSKRLNPQTGDERRHSHGVA